MNPNNNQRCGCPCRPQIPAPPCMNTDCGCGRCSNMPMPSSPLYAASAARLQYDAPYSSSACSLSGQLTPANACKPRFWATADFHRSWLHAAADSLWRWQCPPSQCLPKPALPHSKSLPEPALPRSKFLETPEILYPDSRRFLLPCSHPLPLLTAIILLP